MTKARQRTLIFGARGFVGSWLAATAAPGHEILSSDNPDRIDITDAAACRRAIESARADVVFLAAAMSDIDRCEREPALAEAVNVRGPENIARACRSSGARLLFTSSGAVFDGARSPYVETDPVSPVSVYGQSKARAEAAVLTLMPDAIVVRLSLVLGLAARKGTNALVNKLLATWEKGRPVAVPAEEYRNAIDAATLTAFLLELAGSPDARGIYHAGSANALSRLAIARRLAEAFGYPAALAIPQTNPPAGRAPRGRHEYLLTNRIAAVCRTRVPTCEEAIERCSHVTTQSHL